NSTIQNLIIDFINSKNFLLILCVGTILFYLIKSFVIFLFAYFDAKLVNNLKVNMSSRLFRMYLQKDYLFHSINDPIILGRNISSEVNISVFHIKSFLVIIKEIIQLILIFFLLLFASWKITLIIFLIFSILCLIYLKVFKKKIKKKSEIAFFERGLKSKIINQILNAIIEVKLYNRENFIIKKFTNSISKEFRSTMFLEIVNKIPRILIEVLIVTIVCLTILMTIRLGYNIEIIISFIALYFLAALRAYPSVNSILINNVSLINGQVSINKLVSEFENSSILKQTKDYNKVYSEDFNFNKSIKFSNVYFSYPERAEILKNINLTITKNSMIGIKGETGSGKSTLIKLLMKLLDPTKGNIEIDGINMNTLDKSWQTKIAYIPQNFYILDDTILENIIFSEDESKFEIDKINSILKFCKLYDVVNNLPKKLDTIVGPSGKQLSGGQAQRLAMARALYQDKDILIFDEATNALDESTESEILKKINNLKNTKTIIIISHNNKVLEKCDQSYNIENGYLKQI
ncbi:ABC transporter ATP-binding protein/permease, partial [Candidatus Pelagibacter sp.]|nr:ABC transporter ATP-binding protein/permease [Candidatus Pelagibacter sp.]